MKKMRLRIGYGLTVLLLIVGIVISVGLAVAIGSTTIHAKDVYRVIWYECFHPSALADYASGAIHDVIWLIRLPRIMLAVAVGGGLAICGIVMQALVRNPLADPYLLGISSGASLGATVAILLGVGTFFGENYVGIVAFIGAFSASILVLTIANTGSRANPVKLLLSGLAVNAVFSSFSSFIVYVANDKDGIQDITFWLMGSLGGAKWSNVIWIYIVVFAGMFFFMTQYRTLNMMLLGDEVGITLGISLHAPRQYYMIITSLMIGFIVFASGMIGFVGLMMPHFARMLFGTDHKKNMPIAFCFGAIFMIWADVLSRIVIPYTELPIGIFVSMFGSPFFIYMLVRRQYGFGGGKS
ncbi:iron ABC transporter permease [Fusibacter paucivorans]|uniref:Iron ABC transporter permease n=2 Tax=Fusibacter paucivorans TaxID=76009 RepID=A0ABS5PJR1_9FIRM|nr:iron ABC transporter permease [Fusibacter paucivorans]MBS7525385.1 iron ABC transporter permease [Fusibacter paucivorans]